MKSLWLLGWSLILTLLRNWFTKRRGLEHFLASYADDGIRVPSEAERDRPVSWSACIACGRCELGEEARRRASHGEYPGIMSLVLHAARSNLDATSAARGWRHVPLEVLAEKERDCPAGVPFRAMKTFFETRARAQ